MVEDSNVTTVSFAQSQPNETIDFDLEEIKDISRAKITPRMFSSEEYKTYMLQNFDMSCDFCTVKNFMSFSDVQSHYLDAHQFSKGYVKSCCDGKKFCLISQVKDHIDYHLDPNSLKCVKYLFIS